MRAADVSADTAVEDLLAAWPGIVKFLINEGLPCIVCGEPFWGSLGDLARGKHFSEAQIDELVVNIREAMGESGS